MQSQYHQDDDLALDDEGEGRVARDWESWLRSSTEPASPTEQRDRDRTEQRIRKAIEADPRLQGHVSVYARGSHARGTNVRRDSDVDIAVRWQPWSYVTEMRRKGALDWAGRGLREDHDGPAPPEYRRWIEEALVGALNTAAVDTSGNKAIRVVGGSTTLDADVVPCFRHRRYVEGNSRSEEGIRLYPKRGDYIHNWPEHDRDNGEAKNERTDKRYKQMVRAMKRLENDMLATGRIGAPVPGFFIECLLYNVSDRTYRPASFAETAFDLLAELRDAIDAAEHRDWVEVNGLKSLWRENQGWRPQDAKRFADAALRFVRGG